MLTTNRIASLLSLCIAALLTVSAATTALAEVVWDGSTDTDWSADPDATSWGGAIDTTYNDGDDAEFNGAGAGTVNITASVSPGSVSVTSGSYTFADGGGSIDGTGSLSKSGAGTLIIQTNNTFTGGVDLSGGIIQVANGANEAGYFGDASNTITFSGDARLHNQNGTVTLPQGITINGGVTGEVTGAFGETFQVDGVLAGTGTLEIQGFSAAYTAQFRNLANTFTGSIVVDGTAGHATFGVRSLADGAGTIGLASDASNGGIFEYMNGANAAITFNTRQFVLVNDGNSGTNLSRQATIKNNESTAGETITINTDLAITGTGNKNFMLGGNNAGDNTFNGAIIDAIGISTLDLYKIDNGKWILDGTNTYEGDTHVNQGNLMLGSSGSLRFVIGLTGVNNQILGDASPGTLDLEGAFNFDLSGADTTAGNTWDIVDSSILSNTTFASTFAVTGFTDAGGDLWTFDVTPQLQFQFDESTGVLSTLTIPAPAALPAGLVMLGLAAARRRRK